MDISTWSPDNEYPQCPSEESCTLLQAILETDISVLENLEFIQKQNIDEATLLQLFLEELDAWSKFRKLI